MNNIEKLIRLFSIIVTVSFVALIFQSCNHDNNETIVYQGEFIGSQPADAIKESKVEFIKWENGKSFFRLSTNRIQENQKVTSIQCNFEDGIYRFIIMLSPDNWLDPHPFCYQTVDYYIIGLPAGKIKIAVSLNSGEIPLEEYNVSLIR